MAISKTDFVRGLQCEKMLWLDKHKREEMVIPPEVQLRLNEGNAFGDKAMGIFGDYKEMTAFKEDGKLDIKQMLLNTEAALFDGVNVICEAAFSYYGNYCAVDILRKEPDGYYLYEVKNSDGIKEVFLKDVGFQKYILYKCGVKIKKAFIITNSGDENDPYKITDVTAEARAYEKLAYTKVWELNKIKNSPCEVDIPVGEQCLIPYRCWYYDYCHKLN